MHTHTGEGCVRYVLCLQELPGILTMSRSLGDWGSSEARTFAHKAKVPTHKRDRRLTYIMQGLSCAVNSSVGSTFIQ
jgi:hypothetical protein